jgi:hypothetical protein
VDACQSSKRVDTRLYQDAVRLRPAVAAARSVTCRMAVASGVPSSEESERSRQLGRQDVLDHNPGALVTFGSECQVPPGGAALPIGPEQPLERRRPPRDRLAPIEGCRPEPRPHGVFVPGLIDA